MTDTKEVSSGVQELIDKLKNQGVEAGQKQAEQIIQEAHHKASAILSQAREEADKLLVEARDKIEVERASSHEAIKNAFRDTEITLRAKVRDAFSVYLKRLVSVELADRDFIKQLVLLVAGTKTAEISKTDRIEILLAEEGPHFTEEGKRKLQHLVLGITHDMLREGIDLKPSTDIKGGIKIRLVGEDVSIDLTDDALSNLFLKYLLPRYREIVLGQDQK